MSARPELSGIENFRDFGGYPTAHGRPLRRGRLYRSASHGRATDADLEALAGLDLAVIVDLRRAGERRRDPSRRHAAFAGRVIEGDDGGESDSWLDHLKSSDLSADAFRAYLMAYYAAAPFEPRHVELFRRYFEALETAQGAVLVHCAAGKDRTGLIVALTHHLAGVHLDDMLGDYLLTNDAERFERRAASVAANILEASGRAPTDEAVRVAQGVEAVYLETAFARIAEVHGDADAYLRDRLGLTDARRDAVLRRLLA